MRALPTDSRGNRGLVGTGVTIVSGVSAGWLARTVTGDSGENPIAGAAGSSTFALGATTTPAADAGSVGAFTTARIGARTGGSSCPRMGTSSDATTASVQSMCLAAADARPRSATTSIAPATAKSSVTFASVSARNCTADGVLISPPSVYGPSSGGHRDARTPRRRAARDPCPATSRSRSSASC